MAFFKFPWSAKKAPVAARSGKGSQAARGETVEVMRRRARHRLMGAALLVIVAVVGFPVLFDSQPRSIPVDARIEIPDRENVAPLVVPGGSAPASVAAVEEVVETPRPEPAKAAKSDAAVAGAAHSGAQTAASPAKVNPRTALPRDRDAPPAAFVEARPDAARGKTETDSVAATPAPANAVTAASQQTARQQESERARSLLEGRSGKVSVQAPPIPVAAPDAERFIVQVGAFSDDTKVREARAKLERGGLTTYTQAVQTKDGKRTRVRVGPFLGRQDAEKAAAKIKALGLPAAVLSL